MTRTATRKTRTSRQSRTAEAPPAAPVKVTATEAAEANARSAAAFRVFDTARDAAEATYRDQSATYVGAFVSGVSDSAVARACKAKRDATPDADPAQWSTTPAMVAVLRRAGQVLALDGNLPDGVTARDYGNAFRTERTALHALIKQLPTAAVDHIVATSKTQDAAYLAMVKERDLTRTNKSRAGKPDAAEGAEGGEGAETPETPETPVDVTAVLIKVRDMLPEATARRGQWTAETLKEARAIVSVLSHSIEEVEAEHAARAEADAKAKRTPAKGTATPGRASRTTAAKGTPAKARPRNGRVAKVPTAA